MSPISFSDVLFATEVKRENLWEKAAFWQEPIKPSPRIVPINQAFSENFLKVQQLQEICLQIKEG